MCQILVVSGQLGSQQLPKTFVLNAIMDPGNEYTNQILDPVHEYNIQFEDQGPELKRSFSTGHGHLGPVCNNEGPRYNNKFQDPGPKRNNE